MKYQKRKKRYVGTRSSKSQSGFSYEYYPELKLGYIMNELVLKKIGDKFVCRDSHWRYSRYSYKLQRFVKKIENVDSFELARVDDLSKLNEDNFENEILKKGFLQELNSFRESISRKMDMSLENNITWLLKAKNKITNKKLMKKILLEFKSQIESPSQKDIRINELVDKIVLNSSFELPFIVEKYLYIHDNKIVNENDYETLTTKVGALL